MKVRTRSISLLLCAPLPPLGVMATMSTCWQYVGTHPSCFAELSTAHVMASWSALFNHPALRLVQYSSLDCVGKGFSALSDSIFVAQWWVLRILVNAVQAKVERMSVAFKGTTLV